MKRILSVGFNGQSSGSSAGVAPRMTTHCLGDATVAWVLMAVCGLATAAAAEPAAGTSPVVASHVAAPEPRPAAGASEDEAGEAAAPRRKWDAAIGFIVSYAPEYPGSNRWSAGITPGGWVRWGRLSVATRSAFVVRSADTPTGGGGVRLDLSPRGQKLRLGLSLRQDGGRQESSSPDLLGLGDIRATLRVRLAGSYPLDSIGRVGAALTVDALGRGGGEVLELTFGRGFPLGQGLSASASTVLAFGSRRYMQAYHGITEEQAARSGYPAYFPSAGMRDVAVSLGLRQEVASRWAVFGGVSAGRLVGEAAASPLTREPGSWSISGGVAYRF